MQVKLPKASKFGLGEVKIDVQWPSEQVKLASVVLMNGNFQWEAISKALLTARSLIITIELKAWIS